MCLYWNICPREYIVKKVDRFGMVNIEVLLCNSMMVCVMHQILMEMQTNMISETIWVVATIYCMGIGVENH